MGKLGTGRAVLKRKITTCYSELIPTPIVKLHLRELVAIKLIELFTENTYALCIHAILFQTDIFVQ